MKKNLFMNVWLTLALFVCGITVSCSDDDNDGVKEPPVLRLVTTTGDPVGGISGGDYELTGGAESLTLRIMTNLDWKIMIPEENDWISVDIAEGAGMQDVTFSVAANSGLDERKAAVTLSPAAENAGVQGVVTNFIQPGGPRLALTQTVFTAQKGGEDVTIPVSTNLTAVKAVIPDDVDWITEKSASATEVVLTVSPSDIANSRTAEIGIASAMDEYPVSETVTIRQAGAVDPAELLDVQFNTDKTATDLSEWGNEIYTIGMDNYGNYLNVVYDEALGMNVARYTAPVTNSTEGAAFAMSYKEDAAFASALENGFSIELYARPHLYGSDSQMSLASTHDGGGIAINYVKDQGWKLDLGVGTGSDYVDVNEGTAWQLDKWSHVVGIFGEDKSLSIYVDGTLKSSKSNTNALRHGSATSLREFVIGGRAPVAADQGKLRGIFGGEIAVFRIYDRVLTADEVEILNKTVTGAE